MDNYSRKVWAYPMRTRSNVGSIFEEWQARTETQSGRKIMAICCDNTPELKALHRFIKSNGGVMELMAYYTPEQNGVAERMNRTLIEKAKCMLAENDLPRNLWTDV